MLNRIRLGAIGGDGFFTLFLSNLLLIGSGGLLLVALLIHVIVVAYRAPIRAASAGRCLVLGQMLNQGRPGPDFRQRLERAFDLHRQHPRNGILILGGHTSPGGPSEASAGRDYLVARGVPAECIEVEDHSRHTLENLRQARRLLDGDQRRPILITNRFHLARSLSLARGLGLDPQACAADQRLRWSPRQAARLLQEAYLLHWYHVGRTWSRLTRNQRMLARIS